MTRSPSPSPSDATTSPLEGVCGESDAALTRVATRLVEERARGEAAPDPDRVVSMLRENGEPHVRPRILTAFEGKQRAIGEDAAIRSQLATLKRDASTRCGFAIAKEILVAVAVDALADLEPLTTRARTGEWLTLSASLRAPARNAKAIVLGPRGIPRTVPTTFDRATNTVRAKFVLDRPGAFTVQLVGDVDLPYAKGPQPLLEARVFADIAPFTSAADDERAPGEDAVASDDTSTLTKMTAVLRTSESLGSLARDPRLDALAKAHVEQMRDKKTVAHDLGAGEGDLATRFDNASLAARVVGENVARAKSITLAHRALHASPSHRMNLLRPDFTHLGIAVTRDDAGNVYVCEVFAAGLAN